MTRAEENARSHQSEFVLVALLEQPAVREGQQEREETVKGVARQTHSHHKPQP